MFVVEVFLPAKSPARHDFENIFEHAAQGRAWDNRRVDRRKTFRALSANEKRRQSFDVKQNFAADIFRRKVFAEIFQVELRGQNLFGQRNKIVRCSRYFRKILLWRISLRGRIFLRRLKIFLRLR